RERLRAAAWLLREPGSGTREAIVQALAPHLGALSEGIQFGNSEAIKRAVAQGLGISCLSRWVVADALASGQLVALKTDWPPLTRPFSLVLPRGKLLPPGLARFVDFLRQAPGAVLVPDVPDEKRA
ncbi:MAG: LysR substrate-binding domain-containing protein, partial [Comamonas sp.]